MEKLLDVKRIFALWNLGNPFNCSGLMIVCIIRATTHAKNCLLLRTWDFCVSTSDVVPLKKESDLKRDVLWDISNCSFAFAAGFGRSNLSLQK